MGFAETDPSQGLGPSLRNVRDWISALAAGSKRMLGISERRLGCAITKAELERIFEGLREQASDDERLIARTTITAILLEFQAERTSAFDDEAPF